MNASYIFTLTDGTPLTEVQSLENNGLDNTSVPRRIVSIQFSDPILPVAADTFVVDGDIRSTILQGSKFEVVGNTGYDGTFVVYLPGFQAGDQVGYYDGNCTHVPVQGGVPSNGAFEVVSVQPGINGNFVIEGISNAQHVILVGRSITLADNVFLAANGQYTVSNVVQSTPYIVTLIDSSSDKVVISGNQQAMLSAGTRIRLIGTASGSGDGIYEVQSTSVVLGATHVIINQNFNALPSGSTPTSATKLSLQNPRAIVTITGTIPNGTDSSGTISPDSPESILFEAAPTFTNSGSFTTIQWYVPGNLLSQITTGMPVLIQSATINGQTFTGNVTVVAVAFTTSSPSHPQGFTTVSSVTNVPVSAMAVSVDSRFVFPVPSVPYGYMRTVNSDVASSLYLLGKGSVAYNEAQSWGHALQSNMIHMLENFNHTRPPAAPLVGQLWHDATTGNLRMWRGETYAITQVTPGAPGVGSIALDIIPANAPGSGESIVVYGNVGLELTPTTFTVDSTTSAPNVNSTSGFTVDVVLAEAVPATMAQYTSSSSDAPFGRCYRLLDFRGVVVEDIPALSSLDMGGNVITNVGSGTSPSDALNVTTGDLRYVNATGDAMTGALAINADLEISTGDIQLNGASGITVDSGNVHLLSGDLTLDAGVAVVRGGATIGSSSERIDVTTSGGITLNVTTASTGASVINLNNNKITNASTPTSPLDVANKAYVDSLTNGITWIEPILDPGLVDDSLSAPPIIPINDTQITYHRTYIVKTPGTGAWSGLSGHAVAYNGTAWVSVLGRPVAANDRFGVFISPNNDEDLTSLTLGGGLNGHQGQIATITNVSPLTYTFYTPSEPDAVSVKGTFSGSSLHFGHSFTFRGTWNILSAYGTDYSWIEFSGPQMLADGAGLQYVGNVLNVGSGVGISVLDDSVALDLPYVNSNYIRRDGTTPPTANLSLGNFRITNLGNPSLATDAVNLQTGDARYVLSGGSTMTGSLILNADPTLALGAATKQYVDAITGGVSTAKVSKSGDTMTGSLILNADPTLALGAATKQYVDAKVSKSGDTMTGSLILNADPTLALGAATKQYVDGYAVSRTTSTVLGSGINVTLSGSGEVLGLPATPSVAGAASSKQYVDTQVGLRALDSNTVHRTGTESIGGAKAFTDTVSIAANGTDLNLVVSPTTFSVTGPIVSSGAAYNVNVVAGQNNGGLGGNVSVVGGVGTTSGGAISIAGGAGASTGGAITIATGAGSSASNNGTLSLISGNASLVLDPRGAWQVGGLPPTSARQALVSDPAAPATATPKWVNVATRVASAPASSVAPGAIGEWYSDDNHLYVYGTTGWRRVALATF